MAKKYKTPGIYIREESEQLHSIAAVETAIPAFIGHTETAKDKKDDDLRLHPFKVSSMLEYEQHFGGPQPEVNIQVTLSDSTSKQAYGKMVASFKGERSKHIMFYALQAFFANGGGACYIVSVGAYNNIGKPLDPNLFIQGLEAAGQVGEVTLVVMPESRGLDSISDFAELQNAALAQCAELQDRFVVMDVYDNSGAIESDANAFRTNGVGADNLRHGAAYYPVLETSFDYAYKDENVTLNQAVRDQVLSAQGPQTLAQISSENPFLYASAGKAIRQMPCLLPPSPFMAGVYTLVDNSRGVWKAPANVSLSNVIGPSIKITSEDQEILNVDAITGKSINAIRSFPGQGTLVWGARTLAGNDNEWRYIPVRRFYNMVHESVKEAVARFVFEPNDANTWNKVKAMIESFLTSQWTSGALAGTTPNESFFVKVGLGQTMTPQDVVDGKMIIEIGMAVMRPAEFIVMIITQEMQ